MDSGGEGNGCSSQAGLGYHPTDKREREAGGVQQQQQRCSKRHVTFVSSSCGDEERSRGGHDKVLRSHTRRANTNIGGAAVLTEEASQIKQVATVKQQRGTTKRGLTWKEDEHSGLSSSEEQGERRKRGGDSEWSEGVRGLAVIPSSSPCSPPANETVELGEQAGLGGTTKAGAGSASASSSASRTRRSSGAGAAARRRSRRGEHCSPPPDVTTTTQSTNNTTISSNRSGSNNESASPQLNSVVDGGAGATTDSGRRRLSEELCGGDEPETMCQEDDVPAPHHHQQQQRPSCQLPSPSNSPKSFIITSSVVSEGAAAPASGTVVEPRPYPEGNHNNPLQSRGQDVETEETTPSILQTVVKVENEKNCDGFGESVQQARASVVGRNKVVKSGQLQQSGGTTSSNLGISVGGIHNNAQKHCCNRWVVEDERGNDEKPEESTQPHPSSSVCGNVSMPLLKRLDGGKEGAATEAPASSFTHLKLSQTTPSTSSTRNLRKAGGKKQGGGVASPSSTTVSKSGRSEVSGKGGSVSVSERKKPATTPAPMLLMNNLPYMGELTFDTRPRRGRKPKKADICHLISKNYGIHFPVSYLNLAAAAAAAPPVPPTPALPSSILGGGSTKSNQKRANNNGNINNNNRGGSPAISLVGPIPTPASFCNKDVSIVPIIPSSWSPPSAGGGVSRGQEKGPNSSGRNIGGKPLSLAQQLSMLRPNSSSSQQAISMFPIPSSSSQSRVQPPYKSEEEEEDDEDDDQDGGNGHGDGHHHQNLMMVEDDDGKGNQDSPLNLCMRDDRFKTFTLPHPATGGRMRGAEERSTLDVRWRKTTRTTLDQPQFGSGSFSSPNTVQLGVNNKRNVTVLPLEAGEGVVRKACKSAKLSGTQASSNSNNSYRNSYRGSNNNNNNSSSVAAGGSSVNNLVRMEPIPSLSSSSSSVVGERSGRVGVHPSAAFSMTQRLHGSGGSSTPPYSTAPTLGGGKSGKQQSSSRKKRDGVIRGDIKISPCNSEASSSMGGNATGAGSSSSGFSSFGGGTLFGQSTSGINEGAEVSICKFKFTGGAKPCLQEKKMLSVDSGGNFRFYTDKAAGGPASKLGKGQQAPSSSTATVTSYSGNTYSGSGSAGGEFSVDGIGGTECHFPLSSLPKSAKSMSMCMPFAGTNSGLSTVTSGTTKTTTTSVPSSSSASISLPLPISPTTEELQQLHLSINNQAGPQGATRGSSPSLAGEYSYSSSNSCSSSDNSNENLEGVGTKMETSPKSSSSRLASSHPGAYPHHRHGTGGKLKRKRRTRKSLMREKLEKTFKEKGFLIQTQQLESAEGATYCKFRQLRKFTRYLFRSWKDYLPDHVKEISDKSGNNNGNGENLPGSSQSMLQQSPPSSDGKPEVKVELVEEEENSAQDSQRLAPDSGEIVEEDEEMESEESEPEAQPLERKKPSLISEKMEMTRDGPAISSDEEEDQDQVVLIEASRPPSQSKQSTPRIPQPHSSLTTTQHEMGDDEASDEDEEELQVDS